MKKYLAPFLAFLSLPVAAVTFIAGGITENAGRRGMGLLLIALAAMLLCGSLSCFWVQIMERKKN